MADIIQATFSNAFYFRKYYVLWFIHWNLILRDQQVGIGLDKDISPNRWQAIIWTTDGLVHWRIYTSNDPAKLNQLYTDK